MNVFLLRHTRPALDGHRCYGRLDADLRPGWQEEAARLQRELPADITVITSVERRCRQLAAMIAGRDGREPVTDERLQELDFGRWEGLPWAEIPQQESAHWAKDIWHRPPPGGETYAALYERASALWQSVLGMDADRVALVGNGGPLLALLTIALELPRDAFVRMHLDYASLSLLSDASGGWRLEFANR